MVWRQPAVVNILPGAVKYWKATWLQCWNVFETHRLCSGSVGSVGGGHLNVVVFPPANIHCIKGVF